MSERRETIARRFGANLRRSRRRAGISQEELAERAALHRTHVGLIERGLRVPGLDTIVALARALDVAPAVLISEIE